VSYLFSLQGKLDENLLQLFVDKVNAELFESVLDENLESVDVQDSQCQEVLGLLTALNGHSLVYTLKSQKMDCGENSLKKVDQMCRI
jgi:hypothetical protein